MSKLDFFQRLDIYDINGDTVSKKTFDAVKKLQEQNKTMREALEFYADGGNYGHISPEVATYSVIDNCDLGVGDFMLNETVDDERVGGKRAREALAKVNE